MNSSFIKKNFKIRKFSKKCLHKFNEQYITYTFMSSLTYKLENIIITSSSYELLSQIVGSETWLFSHIIVSSEFIFACDCKLGTKQPAFGLWPILFKIFKINDRIIFKYLLEKCTNACYNWF